MKFKEFVAMCLGAVIQLFICFTMHSEKTSIELWSVYLIIAFCWLVAVFIGTWYNETRENEKEKNEK